MDELAEDQSRMVEVHIRFKIGIQEVVPVEHHISAILEASAAELLEWGIYY